MPTFPMGSSQLFRRFARFAAASNAAGGYGWAMLWGAGLQGRCLKSSRIYTYIYIYKYYIYIIYIIYIILYIYIIFIYLFFIYICSVCIYIYKTIRYNNMWWQLKLYTCSGENERQEQLKDSKILKFWRFVMQGLMASEDCRVMLHFTRFAWASVYNTNILQFCNHYFFFCWWVVHH